MKKDLYRPGQVRQLVERVAKWAAKHPELVKRSEDSADFRPMHAMIGDVEPGYADKGTCFNCGHHMKLAVYTPGIMDALLVLGMAQAVREEVANGTPFTEANLVHVPTLHVSDATRHSVTRSSYLGLVAQTENKRGTGYWVITHWGWKFLRGEPIPKQATLWRGKLIERSEETTTIQHAFKVHTDLVNKALSRSRAVRNDFRAEIGAYTPQDWTGFGGYAEDVVPQREEAATDTPWWNRG